METERETICFRLVYLLLRFENFLFKLKESRIILPGQRECLVYGNIHVARAARQAQADLRVLVEVQIRSEAEHRTLQRDFGVLQRVASVNGVEFQGQQVVLVDGGNLMPFLPDLVERVGCGDILHGKVILDLCHCKGEEIGRCLFADLLHVVEELLLYLLKLQRLDFPFPFEGVVTQ